MADCEHPNWYGITTWAHAMKRCRDCGATFDKEPTGRPKEGPRLPWQDIKGGEPHGGNQESRQDS